MPDERQVRRRFVQGGADGLDGPHSVPGASTTVAVPRTRSRAQSNRSLLKAAASSMNSGKKPGSRVDQPAAVAAASLSDWSRTLRRSGAICGRALAAQKALGSHGRTVAPSRH